MDLFGTVEKPFCFATVVDDGQSSPWRFHRGELLNVEPLERCLQRLDFLCYCAYSETRCVHDPTIVPQEGLNVHSLESAGRDTSYPLQFVRMLLGHVLQSILVEGGGLSLFHRPRS